MVLLYLISYGLTIWEKSHLSANISGF